MTEFETVSQPEVPAVEETDDSIAGIWPDICSQVRGELRPPVSGFFAPNGPIQCCLKGDKLVLQCANDFTKSVVDKPEVLELVSKKASAKLGRPIHAIAVDRSNVRSMQMEQLLQFGRDHSDIINIKG